LRLYDLAMLALLGLLAWSGFRRGFVREVAGLVAFAAGFLLALRLAGPLGRWLATVFAHLSPTTVHVVAFLAIMLLVGLAIDLAALVLSGAISLVPVVGGLNRVGGLLAGAALGVLVVWLLTTCLLLLPPTLLPFTSGVRRSETARLVRGVPTTWSHSLHTILVGSGAPDELGWAVASWARPVVLHPWLRESQGRSGRALRRQLEPLEPTAPSGAEVVTRRRGAFEVAPEAEWTSLLRRGLAHELRAALDPAAKERLLARQCPVNPQTALR
jgi:membrane protein required for colicin V production